MTKPNDTAKNIVAHRVENIKKVTAAIILKCEKMEENPQLNWGHAGSAIHAETLICEVAQFIGVDLESLDIGW